VDIIYNLNAHFSEVLIDLNCRPDTRAYLISIYSQNHHTYYDLSQDNLSILYCQARLNNDFYLYQKIADWIFFVKTIMPAHFNNSNDYYENIGRLSYYSCYKLINRQWLLFEEMADRFAFLEKETRKRLSNI